MMFTVLNMVNIPFLPNPSYVEGGLLRRHSEVARLSQEAADIHFISDGDDDAQDDNDL